ncbi:MAG: type IX secretion system membrane protein PorP/SprF [Paludibacter sp.]
MRKEVLSILFSFFCFSSVFSQFDAQMSQYMFHNSAFNPAAVGEGNMIQLIFQPRLQWIGMPNAPKTTYFSINSPVKIEKSIHGVGFRFLNETAGQYTQQNAHIQYAFKKQINKGFLSIGAEIGYVSIGFNGDSVRTIPIGDFHDFTTDINIPKTGVAGMSMDMSVGLFYSNPKFYSGISYSHLNSPVVSWSDNSEFTPKSTMYFTGGYNWNIPDTKFTLKPSTLVKSDFISMQLDVSSILDYDNKYWGGLSYRIQDAVVVLAGLNVAGGLSIGYSYDLPTTEILRVSSGSHEVVFIYSFEYVFEKRTSKFKSIRFL